MRKAEKISLSIFWFILISIIDGVSSQQCINDTGVFKSDSQYGVNRELILSSLASNVSSKGGFYNHSIGQDSDQVYAMGMCFNDTEPNVCSECINIAVGQLKYNCPDHIEAFTWTPHKTLCFARYSNRSFFGTLVMHPLYSEQNSVKFKTELTDSDQVLKDLTEPMISAARSGEVTLSGVQVLKNSQKVYGFMQCTRDLSPGNCSQCLEGSANEYNTCCRGSQGGIIAWSSCFFRWDLFPFMSSSTGAIDLAPPPPRDCSECSDDCSGMSKQINVPFVVTTVVIVSVLFAVVVVLLCRKKKADYPEEISTTNSLQYDLKTIEAATCTFSKSNMLGQGGFGEVFKGVLQDRSEIAVKRLSKESAQGVQEFKNETRLVAKLQHRNLVTVLGFCMEGEEKILVYEFVPNKSLDHFLFEPTKQGQLNWAKRYEIIVGTAKGILYLHHDSPLKIIHRDLKASNILLDAEMKPKVADFGMARILEMDQSRADTRRVVGTHGYISPEYMMHGQFSTKSDVYSFGVLVLEIISGQRNSNFHEIDDSGKSLITHAWNHWRNGSPLELVDTELGKNYQSNEVTRCIHIALLCVQNDPEARPSLSTIILMLTSNSIILPVPQSPAYHEGLEMGLPPIISVPVSTNDSLINDLVPR